MSNDEFSRETHDYLDGGPTSPPRGGERAAADRLARAVVAYAERIEAPGREVDRAVMAVVREQAGSSRRRPGIVGWLLQPQDFRVRPVLAAAVLVLAVSVTALAYRFGVVGGGAGGAPEVAAAPGTVLVQFELRAPDAQSVSLAGSFNEWSGDATPLVPGGDVGVWSVTVPLAPGEHQYLFVIDGEVWTPDPRAHAEVDDGFGQRNSVITVGPRGVIRS